MNNEIVVCGGLDASQPGHHATALDLYGVENFDHLLL